MWFKNTEKKAGKNVYLLVDRSGSMASNWLETLGSINGYVEKLEDDVNIFLAVFDSTDKVEFNVLRETNAKAWRPLTESEISPRGSTPLYDATGKIIDQMVKDNPERAVLVVMTDGYENASKEYSLDAVKGRLKEIERKDWPTVFLGADFSKVTSYISSTFTINSSNIINTSAATRGMAMGALATKTGSYFGSVAGSDASLNSMKWTDLEKAQIEKEDNDKAAV
jgi:hypothetical protein